LGPAAIGNLLSKTGTEHILVSKRTEDTAIQAINSSQTKLDLALPYTKFLAAEKALDQKITFSSIPSANDKPGSLILHSSGTTGLPKPIHLNHRYVLGYAACHRLKEKEAFGRVNVSTLPLYHVS
jgi:acyl-CoA synthetase (AMP-forming)/AMP-acid ligase II